jgi:hypothetical protein
MPTRQMIHIDRALTNMSVAYQQMPNAFVASQLFPIVPVQKQSDRYFVYLKEDWYRDEAELRAPATESAGGDYRIDNTPSYFCQMYAYHKDITEQDRVNADSPLQPDAEATEFVTEKLLLKREVLWANTFFQENTWLTDFDGDNDFTPWDDPESTPIVDITKARIKMASTTGRMPNVLLLGPYVYGALHNHEDILDRVKYTQKGIVTTDLLASLFGVDQVVVANAILNTHPMDKADMTRYSREDEIDFIYGRHALLAHKPQRAGLRTPSCGYIFTWKGLLGANAYGSRMLRMPIPLKGVGTERIEGEMAFDMKVVARDLGMFFKNAVSTNFSLELGGEGE